MKKIIVLLMFLPMAVFAAATGNITGLSIENDGFPIDIWAAGLTTNGTTIPGLGDYNSLTGNERLIVNLNSLGFNPDGTAGNYERKLNGVRRWRFPYPISTGIGANSIIHATVDTGHGNDCLFKFALSQYVYTNDYNITGTLIAGLYTDTNSVNSAATNACTVTNTSKIGYPKPIANWSMPGWNRWTGTTARVYAPAFHMFAKEGKPLACMEFIFTDEHGTRVTNRETDMRIDRSIPGNPLAEYYTDVNLVQFTNYDQVRCDFIAKPWIGDSNTCLDTTLNLYPHPMPSSITNLVDTNVDYCRYIGVVDRVSGSDVNGRATNQTYANVNSAHYFASIGGAINFITDSNNLAGNPKQHNDAGGALVYVRTPGSPAATNYNWSGATLTAAAKTLTKCWVEVTTYPGDAPFAITNTSGDRSPGHRVKLSNFYITPPAATIPFSGIGKLYLSNCVIDAVSTAWVQTTTNVYIVGGHCKQSQQGLRPEPSGHTQFALIRGMYFSNMANQVCCANFLGNYRDATNGTMALSDQYGSAGHLANDYTIWYGNTLKGLWNQNPDWALADSHDVTNGAAIIQNIFERCSNNGQSFGNVVSSSSRQGTNVLFWYNLITGERVADWGSNGSEVTRVDRHQWQFFGNISGVNGFKHDYEGGGNANRIGNFDVLFMMTGGKNFWTECAEDSAMGGFPPDSIGMYSQYASNIGEPVSGSTNTIDICKWVNRASWQGPGQPSSSGNGDYHIKIDSQLYRIAPMFPPSLWKLPYDIEGYNRGGCEPPGPHCCCPKRAGML